MPQRTITIRPARLADAGDMARFMVSAWLEAHKGQVEQAHWERRRQEWTVEDSERGWRRSLSEIDSDASSHDCIYLALRPVVESGQEEVVGVVMGGPAGVGPWLHAAEIFVLYVHASCQRQGVGMRLLRRAVNDLRHCGMQALIIRCLSTNAPANQFYLSLGGHLLQERWQEEYGFRYLEYLYGWSDSAPLLLPHA